MATHLPQNQYFPNSVAQPPNSIAADTAAAPPQPPVAAAGPIHSSCSATDAHQSHDDAMCGKPSGRKPDLGIATELQDAEPTSRTGGPQRAPAGRAPNTVTPVGALESRLLRALLFELDDEVPLFIRDGLHLRRWNA